MGARRGVRAWVGTCLGTISIVAVAWSANGGEVRGDVQTKQAVTPGSYRLPKLIAEFNPVVQPIPFSHARHVGTLALQCQTCHVGAVAAADSDERAPNGKHMLLPRTEVCMNCHVAIAKDSPGVRLLAEYHEKGEEVPWIRVYRVLKGVNWAHKPHLGAGIKCQTCHGEVGKMEVTKVATPVTAMASCLGCHRASTTNSQCETCHAWPAPDDFRRWSNGDVISPEAQR